MQQVTNLQELEMEINKNGEVVVSKNHNNNVIVMSIEEYKKKFETAMEDDFNTADAIAAIFELVKFVNTNSSAENSAEYLQALKDMLVLYCGILGIIAERKEELLDEEIEALIQERQLARKEKNFARADEIRKELIEKGIILEDTREGVKWKRS